MENYTAFNYFYSNPNLTGCSKSKQLRCQPYSDL